MRRGVADAVEEEVDSAIFVDKENASTYKVMKKKIGIIVLLLLAVGAYFGYDYYRIIMLPNVPSELPSEYVTIPTGATFEEVSASLAAGGYIKDKDGFVWVAKRMSYAKTPMRAGRYAIKAGWSNRQLVARLRSGAQAPVRIAIHNKWIIHDVAGLLAQHLESDSAAFLAVLQDAELLAEYGLTPELAMTAFIPDSYDFYWNTTPEEVLKKMVYYRDQFWNAERLAKAEKLGLTKEEVYTLASIVEKETNQNSEKDRIAGVYYNRLQKGMRLEADPTAKFATGNFGLGRVLYSHLETDSPYNTYIHTGLPPGPIYMSSKASIDKTLDLEAHDYIYFCAKPGGTGYHAFARTYSQHLTNAAKYHAWAREQRRQR